MAETIEQNKNITILMETKFERYDNPENFLKRIIKSGFKLRYIDGESHIRDITIKRCLTEKSEGDVMLFLQKT